MDLSMSPVVWDPALALGHPEIDSQHEALFRRVSALVDAMETGDDVDISVLFDELGHHASAHFAAEEQLMCEIGYPGANVHRAAHARFVREYGELRALYDANGAVPGLVVKTRTWIEGWLRAHIAGVDQALARHLRKG